MATVYDIEFEGREPVLEARGLSVSFGTNPVVMNVSLGVPEHRVVALVGPSGCGKSTLLRCFNRMNELRADARVEGQVRFRGRDLYDPGVDPSQVRRRIGMVFEDTTPFPKSVYDNVAFGPRMAGLTGDLGNVVEEALKEAALWEEVSDRLLEPALSLSAGQRQRLCIARVLAAGPEVLLMDQPASGLDPLDSRKIEELVLALRERYTVVLVTHDLLQAARVSDYTAFLHSGELVEYGPTEALFTRPREGRTEAYLTGRLG